MPHYVDNKAVTAALSEYSSRYRRAKADQSELPQIPELVAESIMRIAERLSKKPNWANYVFREDMVADAVLTCVKYCNGFNPEKSQNGFAYLTQIIHNAFIRSLAAWQKQHFGDLLVQEHYTGTAESRAYQRENNAENENLHRWVGKQAEKRQKASERNRQTLVSKATSQGRTLRRSSKFDAALIQVA